MLTVKNVLWDGTEDVVEARRVSTGRVLNPEAKTNDDEWRMEVFAQIGDEQTIGFNQGKVYVMNSNGKTVAVYDLPALSDGLLPPSEPLVRTPSVTKAVKA